MRIISGSAKGRRLITPSTSSPQIRPVLDKVKESIFNILFQVEGMDVLDIFAGTGSIGLEAISRGANSATFIDNNREAVRIIRKNIKNLNFEEKCRLIPNSYEKAVQILSREGSIFDLIFVDPPYLKNLVNPAIKMISEENILKKSGLIISEHDPKEQITELPHSFSQIDERKYGQTLVTFIQKNKE